MTSRLALVAAAAALLIVRLPSLVQPMGADQGLYAYVGERILDGGLPYRDAWDQKPPAIHFTYAAMRALWPRDSAVAAADILAAVLTAWLLYRLGAAIAPAGAGAAAALIYLLLSNPAFTRVGGVRLRAQCETFIAVAVTASLLLLVRKHASGFAVMMSGVLLGIAVCYKYNAAAFVPVALLALWMTNRLSLPNVARLAAGFVIPVIAIVAVFAAGGGLRAFYDATIAYNVGYSGETYASGWDVVRYILSFPVDRARVDALWTVGAAGCALLLAASHRDRLRLLAPAWVAAACVSIAINGSRGLPQYFIQAGPALALAAAWAAAMVWSTLRSLGPRAARIAAVAGGALVLIAVWRVNQFPKLVDQTWFDARRAIGQLGAEEHLARYSDERKYSPLAMLRLAEYLRTHSQTTDSVYVFGFSPAAYVDADRVSASRFFWSRPVIVGFNEGRPGYGVSALADDLRRRRPAVVALQRRDWSPDTDDSAHFFMNAPVLAGWLQDAYDRAPGPEEYDVWVRRSAAP
jgi:4-amino-4-deoxy-L-arabinose transferase-like glycosyltransferase